ncbi:hypothetical protein L9F63_016714 [Diploptera punctata]|uniref:Essential MCU regulator, mitochondrial n=1 Tax=Diploptera punctata TaxID=6984 RepID=A0AAD8EH66_DIPPU|nr:hypothetical protein L9F63_016714 [Diploptera punctata]
MATRLMSVVRKARNIVNPVENIQQLRHATTTSTGSILPEPSKTPFGLLGILCAVVPGLLIGANISKKIANFLEENDLFVPSDDDDDDD